MDALPARIVPPDQPLGRLAFISRFVRNPLLVVPKAAYEDDFVPSVRRGAFAWVTGPALIRSVLIEERDKFRKLAQIRLLSPLLGKGILTSEGADWKWQRQAASPVFRQQDLPAFVPVFVSAARSLADRWKGAAAVRPIESEMTKVTFDVISATLLPSADQTIAPAVEYSTARFQRAGAWGQLYAMAGAPAWLPQPERRSMMEAVHALRASVASMLREQRADASKDDLMHRLMAARDPESGQTMNDEQLIDNLLTFYLAGHETTAKSLTWTLYLLARSPEWMRRVHEEIDAVAGDGPIDAGQLERMVLVQQVVKEAMRLYPPVPLMTRQAIADVTIGGHEVRAGSTVVMPIYAIHRHQKRWKDPDAFDPERFAPGREEVPRYQYMPFGAGPRICIGMGFALLEAAAILATLLQQLRFEPAGGAEPVPMARVTLRTSNGMPLKVSPRA